MQLRSLVAHQALRRQQPQQRTVRRIHGDRWVQVQTLLVTVIAQAGGVLNHKHLAPLHPAQQMRSRGGHHLRRTDARVVQEAIELQLACAVAAHRSQADTAVAGVEQTLQQHGTASRQPLITELSETSHHRESLRQSRSATNRTSVCEASKIVLDLSASGRDKPGHDDKWCESASKAIGVT